jgi:6-phosphogluconolactonase
VSEPKEPEIQVVSDPAAGAIAAARHIATVLAQTAADHGRVDWATTGGSTPVGIYERLIEPALAATVPWEAVHVWWGDDRYVPRDHPFSNVKAFDDIMLGIGATEEGTAGGTVPGVPIPVPNIHPFRTGEAIGARRGAAWCAGALADELCAAPLDVVGGWPVFDLLLLGIGPDGHLLSVFADSPAFGSPDLALAIPAPTHIEPHVERVTVNPALVATALDTLVVVYGADKAEAIGRIFGPERDPRRIPGQVARKRRATWILDEAAAAGLPS